MGKDELDDLVVKHSPDPQDIWNPEDYGFEKHKDSTGLWYYKNYELRSLKNGYWLLRRKVKNERGNSEMLVKWYLNIHFHDKEFADVIFTKGLK
jgi:hypothetical protein